HGGRPRRDHLDVRRELVAPYHLEDDRRRLRHGDQRFQEVLRGVRHGLLTAALRQALFEQEPIGRQRLTWSRRPRTASTGDRRASPRPCTPSPPPPRCPPPPPTARTGSGPAAPSP